MNEVVALRYLSPPNPFALSLSKGPAQPLRPSAHPAG